MKWFDFNEIIEDRTGNNPKLKVSDYRDYGTVPVIDQGKKLISGYSNDETLKYRYNKPLIIFGDHTCIFKYVDFPFILGADGVKALELKSNIETKYIYYYLNTIKIPETGYDRHFKYLKRIKIPLPPLESQKKIATILDKADELSQNDKKILEKYDQLAQSVFLEMFGDPVKNEKEWGIAHLFEICDTKNDIKCGPFGTQLQKDEYKSEGVPLWGITQINSNFKFPTTEFLDSLKAKSLNEYSIEPLDIVMSRKGNVGKCAIYPRNFTPGIMHSDVLRVRCNKERINPIFLSGQFKWSRLLNTQINNVSTGAIMAGINVTKLKNITIQVPPLSLQNSFAGILEHIENQKHFTQISIQKSEELFQSLLQRAFKGELTNTN